MFTVKTRVKLAVARIKYISKLLWLWGLGVVFGGSAVFVALKTPEVLEPQVVTFYNTPLVQVVEAKEEQEDEPLTAIFTAYSAGDGYTPSETMASGRKVYVGAIACPRSMVLGTIVVVQGKKYTCEDRKAKRFDGEFDIYMATRSEALDFGRKELVYTVDNSGLDR